MSDPTEAAEENGLADALRALPLCDEVFLGMQALNIDLVDDYLSAQETELLKQYIEIERTPTSFAMFVSALSQMWVFAIYEFLRTWRQRASELIAWSAEYQALDDDARPAALAKRRRALEARASESLDADVRWGAFEKACDPEFAAELRSALDKCQVVFHMIEAVRMTLAKHEVPRRRGVFAAAPGYGRIDMETGSIYWPVNVGDNEIDIISRRQIADACRRLARSNDRILPVRIQDRVKDMPNESYGIKRVAVVLDDGVEYEGVWVAWNTEVVGVQGEAGVPFDVDLVLDVRHDPAPDWVDDEILPF